MARNDGTVSFKVVARKAGNSIQNDIRKGVENMTDRQLRQASSRMFSAVNKRIKRIEKSDVISPAVTALKKDMGNNPHFSSRGLNRSQLINLYNKALNFYNLETSTLGGARAYSDHIKNLIAEKIKDKDYISDMFDLMHKASEKLGSKVVSGLIGTNQILQEVVAMDTDNALSSINGNKELSESFVQAIVDKMTREIAENTYDITIEDFKTSMF